LILVSHDRHLLRATVNQLWLVHDGRVGPFDGDLDDYTALVLASRRERNDGGDERTGGSRREQRQQEAAQRQRLASARKPLQNRLQRTETELAKVTDELRELDARLADPAFYHAGSEDEVAAVLKRRGELAQQVETLEARWLKLQEELETIA
jgi:ATP-binding cassette subfamily F protein 3